MLQSGHWIILETLLTLSWWFSHHELLSVSLLKDFFLWSTWLLGLSLILVLDFPGLIARFWELVFVLWWPWCFSIMFILPRWAFQHSCFRSYFFVIIVFWLWFGVCFIFFYFGCMSFRSSWAQTWCQWLAILRLIHALYIPWVLSFLIFNQASWRCP